MDLLKLTEEIILSLVKDKEIVAVKEFPSENENEVLLEVVISESDMPRVIGKSGKVINSIRTIVQASSYLKDNKKVKINIDSI
ncbi:MAG: KH domain-containing protein [Bacilli bacterium]